MTVLILGGTSEAMALAKACARQAVPGVLVSLAGRTEAPAALPVPVRVGGFGGAEGLARFIRAEGVRALVDATHPFAARISFNAASAVAETGIPALALLRPGWTREAGDRWREVDDLDGAVAALGAAPRRVFLTIGRQGVGAFAAAPQHHYLSRSIEPSGVRLPHLTEVLARGPFDAEAEAALMTRAGIELLVTKHSGGRSTFGKIEAARRLGLEVVMIRRPQRPDLPATGDVAAALAFVAAHAPSP